MEFVNVNGIDLAYERRGSGSPLVLIHGYPLDHFIWSAVAVKLVKEGFDLILPDLRGFGKSTALDVPYLLDDFADDIAGLLDHLGIQKTAIAGHSMGGYIALAFAKRYPERVGGLGLISSQVLADSPERKEGRYKSAADVQEKGIQGVVETMTPKMTPNTDLHGLVREIMQRQAPAGFIGALKAMAERGDASDLMTGLQVPVALIHGDADELIPIDRAREVKKLLPHANLVEIQGIGHLPMLEAPEKTADALQLLK